MRQCEICGASIEHRHRNAKICEAVECWRSRDAKYLKEKQQRDPQGFREKANVRHRNWRAENRDRELALRRARRLSNIDNEREVARQYASRNRERINRLARERAARFPDEAKEASRKYRQKYPEKCREQQRRWRENNPGYVAKAAAKHVQKLRAKAAQLDRILSMSPEEMISFAIQRGGE